jgi:hypothetical protein
MGRPTGYEPLDTLKPVAQDLWLIDGPLIRFYGLPFSTRATVVRLASGDIWVHSPTRLTETLAKELEALGPLRHLIAPNWIHYAYLHEWQKRWPDALGWAAPGVAERAEKKGVPGRFDHDLEQNAPLDWAGEIEQMVVEGSKIHREAVFFHHASRTLILTDLIENFEPQNLSFPMRMATRIGGIQAPNGQMPRDMRLTFRGNETLLRRQVERMIGWGPERVILSHGSWFENDAVRHLEHAFRWVLEG